MTADGDWVKSVFQEANGEVPQAFNQLHTNINWALVLLSAILTGVVVKGAFDLTTFGLTIFSIILILRFFVRSCLGYVSLIRWNKIKSAVLDYLGSDSNEKPQKLETLKIIHETYSLTNWYSPLPKRKVIFSNAKFFGLWYILPVTLIASMYQFYILNKGFGWLMGVSGTGVFSILILGIAGITHEVNLFYDGNYFKFVAANRSSIERAKQLSRSTDPLLRRILYYIGLTIMLIGVLVAITSTRSFSNNFDQNDFNPLGTYYVTNLPKISGGTGIIQWQSNSPIVIGTIDEEMLPDLNNSRLHTVNILMFGESGTVQAELDRAMYLFTSKQVPFHIQVTYYYNQSLSNYGLLILVSSGVILSLAATIWKSMLDKNKEISVDC